MRRPLSFARKVGGGLRNEPRLDGFAYRLQVGLLFGFALIYSGVAFVVRAVRAVLLSVQIAVLEVVFLILWAVAFVGMRWALPAARAVYWWQVDLVAAALHGLLGDDDVADPTLRDPPPMSDEELLGGQLRGLLIFALVAATAIAIVLAFCLRRTQ